MTISSDAQEALYKQEIDETFLEIVTVTVDGMDPIRLVNNTQDIISIGRLYRASRFKVRFPSGKIGSSSRATIELSNIDRRPVEVIRGAVNPPVITAALIKASAPDVIEQGPYTYTLRNTHWSATTLSGDLIDDIDGDVAIPKIHYNSQDFPGLF